MTKAQINELNATAEMIARVSRNGGTVDDDAAVYKMYGNLSDRHLAGVALGIKQAVNYISTT